MIWCRDIVPTGEGVIFVFHLLADTRKNLLQSEVVCSQGNQLLLSTCSPWSVAHYFGESSIVTDNALGFSNRPWNASSQSNCLPSYATSNLPYHNSNGWPFSEESSADASHSFSSVAAWPELLPHGHYLYLACHISQCNTWVPRATTHGVPQLGYSNAVVNPSRTADMPNGNIQDFQAGQLKKHVIVQFP